MIIIDNDVLYLKQQDHLKPLGNEDRVQENKDDSSTNSFRENPGVVMESTVLFSTTNEHRQIDDELSANGETNQDINEAANEAANYDGKPIDKLDESELRNKDKKENEEFDPGESKTGDDSQRMNNDDEAKKKDSEMDVNDKTPKTQVYTDPHGIQYDVDIEYLDPGYDDNDIKVVGVTDQEQPGIVQDNSAGKLNDDKVNSSASFFIS